MAERKTKREWELVKVMVEDMEIVADAIESGGADLTLSVESVRYIRKATDDAQRACEARSVAGVMIATMTFYRHLGGHDYHELLATARRRRDGARRGGQSEGLTEAEKVEMYRRWESRIQQYMLDNHCEKRKSAMRLLGIASSTFYKYRAIAKKNGDSIP